ncbi:MAG: ferrous iron transport protein B [Oscillospiraceae bacterium]|nr:ferrous iron transport protein B [Oscillospiraceae bacterium]
MGLTCNSTGFAAVDGGLEIKRRSPSDRVVAIAGNPNVGKSTIFNALTGMRQHTGNWPGKTVATAQGYCQTDKSGYVLVDIPGTYSLLAHSAEEEAARGFLCFGGIDAAVVVCDATCLQRSLNLALQVMELCPRTLVCVNLCDEAKRRGITLDLKQLEENLGVPVVGTSAHNKRTLKALTAALDRLCCGETEVAPRRLRYIRPVEEAIDEAEPLLRERFGDRINPRWLALRLIEGDRSLAADAGEYLGTDLAAEEEVVAAVERGRQRLAAAEITLDILRDRIVSCITLNSEEAADGAVEECSGCRLADRRADKLLTGKALGFPLMILLLLVIFWLTISGANYPSQLLSVGLTWVGDRLSELMSGAPDWLRGILVDGAYRTLSWVVAVMLPPMAIFFPLFTLLEDSGYLPRIAYNLDKPFQRCHACGKQALTMAMGFGCNAAGIVGCRIIDSRRERLIAMLTNAFVPCNGKFPFMLTLVSIFFVGAVGGFAGSALSAVIVTALIILGVLMTFAASRFLSATILRGEPSSFTLELPPYRKPQFGRVIVRSMIDRTLFVLGRAAAVAAPAGALIWILANVTIDGASILSICTGALDPFARLLGMDGVILMAFILGLPANEIVIPIIIMTYMAQGSLVELDLPELAQLLADNGWTWRTAICTILFSLMHWPCSTSLLTVRKEAGGWKWAAAAFLLPTCVGMLICFAVAQLSGLFM